jgi:hypothetical protein
MDRRRRHFQPRLDGLESRQLLSVAGRAVPAPAAAVTTGTAAAATNDPLSQQRNARIDQLPRLFLSIDRNRVIPPELIASIQNNLRALENTLTRPPGWVTENVNLEIRSTLATTSLRQDNATRMSYLFGVLLERSGAPSDVAFSLRSNLNQLMQNAVQNRDPAILAANDFGLLSQMTLNVGIKVQPRTTPSTSR